MSPRRCRSKEILNPDTNRCIKKNGRLGRSIRKRKCSPKQILNYKTERCVKRDGRIGRKIHSRKCSPRQILNYKTSRCVKRNGRIGQRLLKKSKRRRKVRDDKHDEKDEDINLTIVDDSEIISTGRINMRYFYDDEKREHSPDLFRSQGGKLHDIIDLTEEKDNDIVLYKYIVRKYGTELFTQIPYPIKFIRILGHGSFGEIFKIYIYKPNKLPTVRAIKIEKINEQLFSKDMFIRKIENEFELQYEMEERLGNAPAVHRMDIFKNKGNIYGWIMMERLHEYEQTVGDMLKYKLNNNMINILLHKIWEIIHLLCEINFIHADLHFNNMVIVPKNPDDIELIADSNKWTATNTVLLLLDYGWSVKAPCNKELEILSLIRSSFNKNYNSDNRKVLFHYLTEYYNHYKIGDLKHIQDFYAINNRYNKLFKKYSYK